MAVLDRFRLDGKAAIVTGASSGLGVGFALALGGGRRRRRARRTAGSIASARSSSRSRRWGGAPSQCAPTSRVPEDCTALVEAALAAFQRVDILVNNAGVSTATPATRERPEDFRQVVDVNLNGAYWMAQACGRVMQPGSSIVNIGSVLGFTTDFGLPQAAYCSTKAAIVGLTRDLAQQWGGRKGIRVNALAPGYFPSEMTDQLPDGYLDDLATRRVPMQRLGEPEELGPALVFLASDASSYVNGIALPVDGGLLTT